MAAAVPLPSRGQRRFFTYRYTRFLPRTSSRGYSEVSHPWHMSVFDAELFAASCALQYAAALSPPPKVVSLGVDNQAALYAISRPGYSY